MKKQSFIITCLLLLFSNLNTFAQDNPIVISGVDRDTIRIGDIIQYSIIIAHSPGVEIQMPGIAIDLDDFEIRDYKKSEPEERDGKIIEKSDYEISTFEIGERVIPSINISYRTHPDSAWKSIMTQEIPVLVQTVQTQEEIEARNNIRDIKPPLELPLDLATVLLISALVILLIGLGVWIYWRYKKKRGETIFERKEPPRPAHEIALEKLYELENSDLLNDGEIKEYYDRLSDIIREYLEGRYFVYALEMTSDEIMEKLENYEYPIQSEVIYDIRTLLQTSDLAKFAKYKPADDTHKEMFDKGLDIVNRTKFVLISEREHTESANDLEEDNNTENITTEISERAV